MKSELLNSFVEGFKDSFRLLAGLAIAISAVFGAFSAHALHGKLTDSGQDSQSPTH